MNSLIVNINAFRKARGITQKKLAEMIGRTESSIRKYENGMVEPPISVVIDIYKALGIKLTLTYEAISEDGDDK
ncbi:helix-turn-helix domain-containing protein [Cellulosilyticum lentocellum]|uniref:Helix-turn-helix domain protein n=1 Tax=Cellulosilyticum lentocellum (strain ATCC 49066 / DSM 5427 / NCIMB 11756 / RHM5) TaxID=642492 RepID=F2JK77_CELLD|nr:helix-turn-helix transcriptional regulator [Cellulosilyticum lentocellum]ADZ84492.1 helix-turn-helix domain protein [Cellulosilyticum lentocellum DSM 5427]